MVVDRKKPEGTSSAMFGIGTAAKCNSSDLPTEFAGGDHLSVPCAVPMMSALPNDWFRFSFCYSYGSQLFGLESVSASQQNTTKMKSSKAKATMVMRFPAKKKAGCPKVPRDFPPRKDGILPPPPRWVALALPPSPSDSVSMDGRTLTYQIFFPMVLRCACFAHGSSAITPLTLS